ncbi:MAG: sugar phosphate isomerase/epimerase [Armatimonadetes bacterium]|nr:sugar phosphate isomerase/epimerase [Armatimonadota bacterium]
MHSHLFRNLALSFVAVCALGSGAFCASRPAGSDNLKIGLQAYTFRSHTFEEAVAKTSSLGLRYIEGYPGQKLSGSMPGVIWSPDASAGARRKARQILQNYGVQMHNLGVVGLPGNEEECRKVFDFAKEMGVKVIVSEPEDAAWPIVERLTKEYNIKVAIHNHPAPSHYFDPSFEMKVLSKLNRRIGACPDVGHWARSGFDPLNSLKMLRGRVLAMHIKDLNRNVPEAHDVVFGTGVINFPAIFQELRKQSFEGVISIEYEGDQPDPFEQVQKSLQYLRAVVR